jgi:4-amino-4-deoxy-L-arabinose transferase-like glycosyltransferase
VRGRDRSALFAFLAVALVLRVAGPLNSGLWFDEIWMIVDTIRAPFASLFTTFESDNHHPLYGVAAWISVRLFGEEPWSVRLPALVFGVASVGAMWRLSLRVTDRGQATLATLLLCVSYHHVWFSQNARGYTMLLFWTLAATYYLLETYEGGGRRAWVAYAVCLALATFTHSSAVLVAVGHGVVSLAVVATAPPERSLEDRWAPILGLLTAGALSLLLHAGLLGDMLAYFAQENAGVAVSDESDWFSLWWTIAAVVESVGVPPLLGYTALLGGVVVAGAGTLAYVQRDWRQALVFVIPGVVSVAATVGLGRSLRPRFLFPFAGFGLLILVAGTYLLVDRVASLAPEARRDAFASWTKRLAAAVLLLGSLAILPKAYTMPKQDFEGGLAYVREVRNEDDAVVTVGLTVLPYRYYEADFPEVGTTEELDALLDRFRSVYVLHTIPIFLESTNPALADRLAGSAEVARFRGSLGDGDVVVYRLERAR